MNREINSELLLEDKSNDHNETGTSPVLYQLPVRPQHISQQIKARIKKAQAPYFAGDSISEFVEPGEIDLLTKEVETKVVDLLESLVIDTENDHNTQETAKRLSRMFVNEIFHGRYHAAPNMTEFPNAKNLSELFTLGPIKIRSTCSHHFAPIIGNAWIGLIPGEKVLGISKFNRLVHWFMSRPHIQEEASVMLADHIEKVLNPKGLGLIIQATHMCMSWRGVKEHNSTMTNIILRGELKAPHLGTQFVELCKTQGFSHHGS